MKKTVYIHIGQTKTATTTLQAFFAQNRQWLAGRGVYYPESFPGHPMVTQHRFLVEVLAGKHAPYEPHVPEWDYLREKLEATPLQKILLSEEVFWHLFERRPDEKISILQWMKDQLAGFDVKIVCYLRRQDKWIESWFNQLTKTDVNHYSKMSYPKFIETYKAQGMLDYNIAMNPWASVFGEENLIVRAFEKILFKNGDIVADFLSILDIQDDIGTERPVDLQVSLHNSACEISHIYNATPQARVNKKNFMRIVAAYDEHIIDRRRYTENSVVESLLHEFLDSNKRLSLRFKGRLPEFFDNTPPNPEQPTYPGLGIGELAEFMMHMYHDQQLQAKNMRKKIIELERLILQQGK